MEERALKAAGGPDDGILVEAALAESPSAARRLVPRRLKVAGAVAAACALGVAGFAAVSGSGDGARTSASAAATPARVVPAKPGASLPAVRPLRSHPKVVVAVPPGQAPPVDAGTSAPAGPVAQPPSDAEVRNELATFRQHLTGSGVARGAVPEVRSDGTAVAPLEAPDVVATVIAAGNAIATTPYKWGGGHGAWRDTGYDCSGSVSFALAGAGLMTSPLVAAQFMHWGANGPGRWITVYASPGHTFMVVAGLRFDTSGAQGGTRWQSAAARSYGGFVARHPPGL
ncbi:MAG: peptidoglycan DL-endopeptidase RipB [Thermoleophilaceae bacterium]|nr:peptidoglycan DL-endopeptidase RipB [Thermoleophilaceae bacterium]